ncbi:competence protein CoiA family protein [Methylophaga nitratireducenticrescens]|uniref:Competence protein n=1 Tax=Methylophaga nitratireducenticrescens TaxID=754476 RepID=I1XH19_METNJ|nr:competence protein CoiA family protein [Methylophaga nitratireducenticrescens]AFI83688.1 hypothetical protein Q7A_846 [Methylophaga nitratireducenticrescens]AUZ83816.1 hypothetical protein CDW43_04175 [Methylophaga nitratireducenticrescens]
MALVKIGWGKTQDGKFIHVNEATRGKKCNCTCPECGTPLISRQGEVTAWHFAHSLPVECYGESVLHKVAKQIITEAADRQKSFLIPSLEKELTTNDLIGKEHLTTWKYSERIVLLDDAKEEIRLRNGLITDVLVSEKNQETSLAVEIFVTHKKSEIDIQKFSEIKQDVIEIDLSKVNPLSDRKTLEEHVLRGPDRYWLFNQEESNQLSIHQQNVDKVNQNYIDEMMQLVLPTINSGQLKNLRFMWPQLTKNVSKKGIFTDVLFGKALKTPKITELNYQKSYSLTGYGCVTACFG